jgi:hypothetical protein
VDAPGMAKRSLQTSGETWGSHSQAQLAERRMKIEEKGKAD